MKIIVSTFLLFVLAVTNAAAQKIFWAAQVEAFSSERTDVRLTQEYRAVQALGVPNRLPNSGESICAWSPALPDNTQEEFIRVRFDTLMPIQQVLVLENTGAGSIVKITATDELGKVHTLLNQNTSVNSGGVFRWVLPQMTTFSVRSLTVVLQTNKVPGWNQIDAIGISQSTAPFELGIRVSPDAPPADKVLRESLSRINTRYSELWPIITKDGKTLYFTRQEEDFLMALKAFLGIQIKKIDLNIFYSELALNGEWSKPKAMPEPINNKGKNALFAVSTDGRELFLLNTYLPNGKMEGGISVSKRQNEQWSFPKEMKIRSYDNRAEEAHFNISADGKVLLMSINFANKTRGKRDLYVCFRESDYQWSEPKNLGIDINTAENEISPFLASDGRTLYFSTKGFPGFGQDDVFKSTRLDDTWQRWSQPENLGPGINTVQWDAFFTLPAGSDYAYIATVQQAKNQDDLVRLRLPKTAQPDPVAMIRGQVLDASNKKPLLCDIAIDEPLNNRQAQVVKYNPLDGPYQIVLPLGQMYHLTPRRQGYLSAGEELDFSKDKNYKEIQQTLFLYPIEVGQTFVLKQVQFAQGSSEVLPTSFAQLRDIAQQLIENKSLEILLEGHTDNQGDFQLNLRLSEDRVKSVRTYLTSRGVAANRIQIKGWGSTKPIDSNLTEERRKRNRRVEFTILKK
jgi:outer membrane protein OmpA-like peptidoglycan-associated protein